MVLNRVNSEITQKILILLRIVHCLSYGNLIFKNKELMDKYNQLPKEDKVNVTGDIRVK